MLPQIIPIDKKGSNPNATRDTNDLWFDAFNFAPGQDEHIRWLSQPNQQFLKEILSKDAEKFRITFDVENFQADQIKIFIQNRQLTITGVYEERTEGRYTQKQFEKSFDIPENGNVEAMAAYLTPDHKLVVEIPLGLNNSRPSSKGDLLNVNSTNNQRRLSFSLNKFNTMNNGNSTSSSVLSAPSTNSQVRRTSITKTVTTTTTSQMPTVSSELHQRNRNEESNSNVSNERRASKGNAYQIVINEPDSTPKTISTDSVDLASLGIELPPELLKHGGTITIQKRRVSVTRTGDPNVNRSTTSTINHISSENSQPVALEKSSSSVNENNQSSSQLSSSARRSSTTILTNNDRKLFTLEEFLQNKVWNPSIVNDSNGKQILQMRLEMKPGTRAEQLRITLNGYELRVEANHQVKTDTGGYLTEQSYRQITLFPTCDVHQLTTVLKPDGFLHIQVPIQL